MLWFQPYPWGRWALVILLAAGALYVEFRPDSTEPQPFATAPILPGDVVDSTNSELRQVPAGLLEGAELGAVATRHVAVGEPVLVGDVNDPDSVIPVDWWVVSVTLPAGATAGDRVRLVLLDSGLEVEGVVADPGSDDPFAAADGGVAVPPDSSSQVALAAANERLAVLIATS